MDGFSGEGLACMRGDRRVFVDLAFGIAPGRVLLLTGANGSGKSTLLRIMAGLLRADAGLLRWNGSDIADDDEAHRRRLAYVGHADPIKPALSVIENLTFWARLNGRDSSEEAALIQFGIEHLADMPARYLSAGQRRRLTLAQLAIGQNSAAGPPLWLLDEPATGLDATAVSMLANTLLAHLASEGIAVIASHGGALDQAIDGHASRLDLACFAN